MSCVTAPRRGGGQPLEACACCCPSLAPCVLTVPRILLPKSVITTHVPMLSADPESSSESPHLGISAHLPNLSCLSSLLPFY